MDKSCKSDKGDCCCHVPVLPQGPCFSVFQDGEVGYKERNTGDSVIRMQCLPHFEKLGMDGIVRGDNKHTHCSIYIDHV
jgi:hypothetical protein